MSRGELGSTLPDHDSAEGEGGRDVGNASFDNLEPLGPQEADHGGIAENQNRIAVAHGDLNVQAVICGRLGVIHADRAADSHRTPALDLEQERYGGLPRGHSDGDWLQGFTVGLGSEGEPSGLVGFDDRHNFYRLAGAGLIWGEQVHESGIREALYDQDVHGDGGEGQERLAVALGPVADDEDPLRPRSPGDLERPREVGAGPIQYPGDAGIQGVDAYTVSGKEEDLGLCLQN